MKIYKKGNYLIVGNLMEHASKVKVSKNTVDGTDYNITCDAWGVWVAFADVLDENGVAYTSNTVFNDFLFDNTGFNPASGGSEAGCETNQDLTYQNGFSISTSTVAPFSRLFDYSWYANIFLSNELGKGNKGLRGLEFEVASHVLPLTIPMRIYVANVVEEVFNNPPVVEMTDLTITNRTLVFDGNIVLANGWNSVTFDDVFCAEQGKNIVIEYHNLRNDWDSQEGHGLMTGATSKGAFKAVDGAFPTGNGTLSNLRINTRLKY